MAYWPSAWCVCVPGLTELFIYKPDQFLFAQISFLIALLFYDNSAPGLEDLPSPAGHSTGCGWGQRHLPRVSTGTADGLLAPGELCRTHWANKNHRGIERFLSYCSAVGRSKWERKDQLPLKERGREASPAGLTLCSLAAKNCTAFAFPVSCGKFMGINGEIISLLYWGLLDIHILLFF